MKKWFLLVFVNLFFVCGAIMLSACDVKDPGIYRHDYEITEESFEGQTLPFVYLEIENEKNVISQDDNLCCNVSVTNTDEEFMFSGDNKKSANITGVFNWSNPKKSYTLKFNSETDLFGFGLATEYVFISNYQDKSLSRNMLAYGLSKELDAKNCSVQPVNLFLNGKYYGVYLLGEKQESKDEVQNDFLESCFETVCGDDYNAIKNVLDVESFAKSYLIHEMFGSNDLTFYKNGEDKLCADILGIFENTSGNSNVCGDAESLYVEAENDWFNKLLKFDQFDLLVSEVLKDNKDVMSEKVENVFNYQLSYEDNNSANFDVWPIMGISVGQTPQEITDMITFSEQLSYLKTWIENKIEFIEENYLPDSISEDSFEGKTFPFVYVNVENNQNIVEKDTYLDCLVSILNADEKYCFSGEDAKTAKIKGRGNSTWNAPKKPYKLKFNSKVDLFGFGKAKQYTLLANYYDKSLTRNLIAYTLSEEFGIDSTSKIQTINLFVNGKYQGVYTLCEQNEIGESRVNIESDLSDVDTGYLIEMDKRAPDEGDEGVDYFLINSMPYALKDPEASDSGFTSDHFNFIKTYVENCFNAICGTDYSAVTELLNIESFAKCYIIHELMGCVDVNCSSFYFHKNKGGKLFAGPLWDFDISSGDCEYSVYVNDSQSLYVRDSNVWYNNLLNFEEFQLLVKDILLEYIDTIKQTIENIIDSQTIYKQNNRANFKVWQVMGSSVWSNLEEVVPQDFINIQTFDGQLNYLKTWVLEKFEFMKESYIV